MTLACSAARSDGRCFSSSSWSRHSSWARGVAILPDRVEHLHRAGRHDAGGDRRAADDADHHHRRDRHLGRVDRRALPPVHGGVHGAGLADRSGDARGLSRRNAGRRLNGVLVAYGGPALAGRHDRHARALSRHRADHPQGARRQQVSGMVPGHRLRHDRRNADPLEHGDLRPSSSSLSPSTASDALGPGALRDRQQPRGRALFRHRRRADDARRSSPRRASCRRSRRSC